MNNIKMVLVAWVSLVALAVNAAPRAQIIEKASHDIMKLAKFGKLQPEFVSKLHMIQVAKQTDGQFKLVAVIDHNEDHTQTPAHLKMDYNDLARMQGFDPIEGYFNPNPSPFTGASPAKLFDLAAEVLLDSDKQELKDYAETVSMMHLEFDKTRNLALFEMLDITKKELKVWLDLDGNLVEYKFE